MTYIYIYIYIYSFASKRVFARIGTPLANRAAQEVSFESSAKDHT